MDAKNDVHRYALGSKERAGAKRSLPPSALMCETERKASLGCIMDHNGDKSKCSAFFERYKECKKRKTEARRQEVIARRNGAQ